MVRFFFLKQNPTVFCLFFACRFILQSKGVIHNQLLEKQRIAEEKIKELEVSFQPVKMMKTEH